MGNVLTLPPIQAYVVFSTGGPKIHMYIQILLRLGVKIHKRKSIICRKTGACCVIIRLLFIDVTLHIYSNAKITHIFLFLVCLVKARIWLVISAHGRHQSCVATSS